MSKRKESLTGGTGDVNPQWYKMNLAQTANDTAINQAFQLPVTRIPHAKKVTIIEVLKIAWFHSMWPTIGGQATVIIEGFLTTANPGVTGGASNIPAITDGSLISQCHFEETTNYNPTYTYSTEHQNLPVIQDLTDGAGHGFLVATDQIYMIVNSAATAGKNSMACWLYYRFKSVGIEEYVGIVQGQSNL